jgi:hypothetical protein
MFRKVPTAAPSKVKSGLTVSAAKFAYTIITTRLPRPQGILLHLQRCNPFLGQNFPSPERATSAARNPGVLARPYSDDILATNLKAG